MSLNPQTIPCLTSLIGGLPYRMTLAGGWIDQPFLPPQPSPRGRGGGLAGAGLPLHERAGIATAPRVASRPGGSACRKATGPNWSGNCTGSRTATVRILGSQDMAAHLRGISRLDYDSRWKAASSRGRWKLQ